MPELTPDEFLSGYPDDVHALADTLRALVREALPDARERVMMGWRLLGYRVPLTARRDAYFGFVSPSLEGATLGFEYGALLESPLLTATYRGQTLKQVRYITVRRPDDVLPDAFRALIREAADLARNPNVRNMIRRR